ncbi:tyrosine-type recombinase/integrase [Roseobacter ponti]|uniref:Site-specific integrase n=1 Tax=Roseobacter ponti TaxID=1891787 RepID=A0A858SRZ4_9RHOB|nr:site-specific integrase [Roseobacter ponti]QJF50757.1 site-specific integrase [Roseobacter ponti]
MATIRKTKAGTYNVQVRLKGKIQASRNFRTKAQATQWAERKEQAFRHQHPLFLDTGYAYCHEVLDRKPSQRLALNRIDRICQHSQLQKTMDTITLQDVNAFKQARLSEVSKTTCSDEIMMIRRVFRWYITEHHAKSGEMLKNPCDLLTMPKANKPRDRVVTRKELDLLLGAMSPQMAVIVELAYETAMRRGELLKLTPGDLNLSDRFLRVVDGKEGSRDVPLTRRAVELLEAVSEGCAGQGDRLFPMAGYSVTQAVRRAREAVGLSADVRFHQLRHSRITEVARMGLNQLQIMLVSGHRDIRSVQRYSHLNVRDVVNLID